MSRVKELITYKDISKKYKISFLEDLSENDIKSILIILGIVESCTNCSEVSDAFTKKCYFCGFKKVEDLNIQYIILQNLPRILAVEFQNMVEIVEDLCYYKGLLNSKSFLIFKDRLEIKLVESSYERVVSYCDFESGLDIIRGYLDE